MRIKGVFKPSDCVAPPGSAPAAETEALFAALFPGVAEPEIAADHAGLAIAAVSPKLALRLAELSRFMALDLDWSQRADLRELAILTLNLQLNCTYGYETRLGAAKAAGLSDAALAAIPDWQVSQSLDEEQRLVVEYTGAVVANRVDDALFGRVAAQFGEAGTVEFTALIGFWSCWALFLNATR